MYLKRLEINGFKSFVNNTEIDFQPGIGIIVGPNGCGKSNLVDAIRWVLGESNIRHLRGHKSEDIIFSGTDKQKALGMAQVEMTVDNSDHLLPVEYNEVTIGRKVFRSGESEFYLNKSRVRMKDITRLFAGTGLGKNGYSIIGQGELEQVLSGQPLDRRLILEEASGIIKYRHQRDEVRRRIDSSKNDLLRLQDILAELRLRKNDLFDKAEKARICLNKFEELTVLDKEVICFELAKLDNQLQKQKSELEGKISELNELINKQACIEKDYHGKENRLKSVINQLNRLISKRHSIESDLAHLEGEMSLCAERVKNSQERLKLASDDEEKYAGMLKNLCADIQTAIAAYNEEESRYNKKAEEYAQLKEKVENLEQKNREESEYFEKKKASAYAKTKMQSELTNLVIKKEEKIKKAKEEKERLTIHIRELENRLEINRNNQMDLNGEKAENEKAINNITQELKKLTQQKMDRLHTLENTQKIYNEISQKNTGVNNRLLMIQEMHSNLTGYSKGVKAVLNASQKGYLKGIIGIIGEMLTVPEGLEIAIDVAVGKGLENILVDDFEKAQKAINYLKENRIGRVTFLPIDSLKIRKVPPNLLKEISLPGMLGLGSRLVKYDIRFEKPVEYLLGHTLIVEDIEQAIRAFRNIKYPLRIVSLAGELINVSGAVTGGIRKSAHSIPLQRKAERKKLQKLFDINEELLGQKNCEITRANQEVRDLTEEITELNNQLTEKKFLLEMQIKQIAELVTAATKNTEEKNLLSTKLSKVDEEIILLTQEVLEINHRKQKTAKDNALAVKELEACKDLLGTAKRQYEVYQERLTSHKEQLAMKKRELQNMKKNISQFEQVQISYQESKQDAEKIGDRLQEIIVEQGQKIGQLKSLIIKQKETLIETTDEVAEFQAKEKELSTSLDEIQSEILPVRKGISQVEDLVKNTEISIVKIETEQSRLKDKWEEKYPDAEKGQENSLTAGKIKDNKQRIAVLEKEIQTIGPVNPESIKEYQEVKERFEFINNQYDDLCSARISLGSVLQETERIMVEDFNQFLLLAKKSFNQTFVEIFGGGEADLSPEAGENHLETGINIQVKMPGKKMQELNLLSGGERALTCIAFSFALLRLKPAPFCLFDEIDASLDETNLLRFSRFIEKMARDMQFIVITHRQSTISAGKNIYGITMHEEGISSVLAINLEEAEKIAV